MTRQEFEMTPEQLDRILESLCSREAQPDHVDRLVTREVVACLMRDEPMPQQVLGYCFGLLW